MQQLKLSLSRADQHWEVVNARATKDLIVWTPGGEKKWYSVPANQARAVLSSLNGQKNVYVTPNEFFGWRLVRLLARLNALYVDLDGRQGEDPAVMVEVALNTISQAQLPTPNYVVFTGRGAHLYWLFLPVSGKALPRWQACQARLQKLLNSDPAAVDCTRVLRVVGSQNPKAPASRRTVVGEQLSADWYDFDWLTDQILPVQRALVRDLRAQLARKAETSSRSKKSGSASIYGWWGVVYEDLVRIINFHWFGGVPEGHRDTLLFLLAVALSWFTHGDALRNEIEATARHLIPTYSAKEVSSYTSTVVAKAIQSSKGEAVIWEGIRRDPRYWFKRQTLYDWVAPLILPELINELRAIVPLQVIQQRRRQRDGQRDRVVEGRYTTKRHGTELREVALQMRSDGASIRQIATALAVGKSTVSDWLRVANTGGAESGIARFI
jgi:hypothetical protein